MKGIVFTKPKFLKNLFRRNRPKFDIRKNAMFLLLCLFLLVGVILGVICARNGDKSLIEKLDFLKRAITVLQARLIIVYL